MSTGRVVGIVIGSLVFLTGLALALGGGGILIADRVMADENGYVSLRSGSIDQEANAVVAQIPIEGGTWFWRRNVVTLRLEIETRNADGKTVFVGLADRLDVDRYLAGAQVAEVRNIRFPGDHPAHRPRVEFQVIPGSATPAAPALQTFWLATASGTEVQSLEWRVRPGDYTLVVMNADASRGIHVAATVGARAPIVLTLAGVMLGVGIFLLGLGLVAVILSARGIRGSGLPLPAAAAGAAGRFPLVLGAEYGEALSPALWIVKWILLIPHFVVLGFLWAGFVCSWGLSLVAILFTGRYPRGLFEYNVGVLRWTWRVGFYGYQALATDKYPPFSLRAGGYPADLQVAYPEKLSRGLVLIKWWLLAIPHYLILAILVGGGPHCGGLVILLALIVGVLLLFSGRYPRELFTVIVGANRWAFRVIAYAALMTDVYPPFSIEE